ncbi:MAG: hypothetical protein P8R42_23290 [Candidatus Binatia bacterium]|nr:hypothetical protein [Candidatus Binatia bacterium]
MALFDRELAALTSSARRERGQEISVLTTWNQWEELHRHEGFSVPRTRRVLSREMLAALAPETN